MVREPFPGLPTDPVRAFVAVPLPAALGEALGPHLAAWAQQMPRFRWVSPHALHLTLRFLGRVEPGPLVSLISALAGIEARPFEVRAGELHRFGGRGSTRVIWMGLDAGADEAASLARQVDAACAAAGFGADRRPWRAHVTLARSRVRTGAPSPERLPAPAGLPSWTAREMVLFESRLGAGPAVHVALRRFPLSG